MDGEAIYAGFTESQWRAYAEDRYTFRPPDVCTAVAWDTEAWMSYLFGRARIEEVPRGR